MDLRLERLSGPDLGVVLLGLDRPEARNALGRQLMAELGAALDGLGADPEARILVIHSLVPGVFCAGADLKERAGMTPEEAEGFVAGLRRAFTRVAELPMPVIAALEGAAFGGGLELALAADLRVAGAEARMGLVETSLAIIPGAGGTQRLPRLIGAARAKELMFTARRLGAEEAGRLGLVDRVVPAGQALDTALGLAREILPNGPIALRMVKRAVEGGLDLDLEAGLELEARCYAQVLPTQDRLEGLAAFREKRKPLYRGH